MAGIYYEADYHTGAACQMDWGREWNPAHLPSCSFAPVVVSYPKYLKIILIIIFYIYNVLFLILVFGLLSELRKFISKEPKRN